MRGLGYALFMLVVALVIVIIVVLAIGLTLPAHGQTEKNFTDPDSTITPSYFVNEDLVPYSCRLLYDEEKKCAFGSCDKRVIERLTKECLRDGGRP